METSTDRELLRVVEAEPFNAETPLGVLGHPVTPIESFFVRSNFAVPRIDADAWRLSVEGLVRMPLSIGLREIQALGQTEMSSVMECAGNGRRLMSPVPGGTAWELGAVSAGVFTGVPLVALLEECGVDAEAVEIVFAGADSGPVEEGRAVRFERSLPVARALDRSTLLVWAMNGEPLRPEHGFPLRLFVPGYYGVASVKWLERIVAVDTPFTGHFQKDRYVYRGHPQYSDEAPVTRMHVRSLIVEPGADAEVGRTVRVRGTAWSGHGDVTEVQVSGDGGATWRAARVAPQPGATAPAMWECEWTAPAPGQYELTARAADSSGQVQPMQPVWNGLGYANNVVHRVRVTVR